jgi:hypothetical protein
MNKYNSDTILDLGKLISYSSSSSSSCSLDTDTEPSEIGNVKEDNCLIIKAVNEFSQSISIDISWDMENIVDIMNNDEDEYDEYDGRVFYEVDTTNKDKYYPFTNKSSYKMYFDGLLKFLSLKFVKKTFSFISVKTRDSRCDHILWNYNYDSESSSDSSSDSNSSLESHNSDN